MSSKEAKLCLFFYNSSATLETQINGDGDMAKQLSTLETKMSKVFLGKAPKMPAGSVKVITEFAPWLALVGGLFTLFSALELWHWAHVANRAVDYVNSLCNAYAGDAGASACSPNSIDRFSLWLVLTIVFILVEGILYLLAYPGLKARTKDGWNYLFYGALANLIHAVLSLFTSYHPVSNFIGALIGSVFSLWVLFQIRSVYTVSKPIISQGDAPKL